MSLLTITEYLALLLHIDVYLPTHDYASSCNLLALSLPPYSRRGVSGAQGVPLADMTISQAFASAKDSFIKSMGNREGAF